MLHVFSTKTCPEAAEEMEWNHVIRHLIKVDQPRTCRGLQHLIKLTMARVVIKHADCKRRECRPPMPNPNSAKSHTCSGIHAVPCSLVLSPATPTVVTITLVVLVLDEDSLSQSLQHVPGRSSSPGSLWNSDSSPLTGLYAGGTITARAVNMLMAPTDRKKKGM